MSSDALDGLLAWLALPWSGAADHAVTAAVAWHGRLMVLAWGVAVPIALLLARYFKVTARQDWPRELDNPFWWHGHRLLNYGAGLLMVAGAGLLLLSDGRAAVGGIPDIAANRSHAVHRLVGWVVIGLASLQILGAHLRGSKGGPTAPRLATDGSLIDLHGDHFDMTPRRILFERLHKALGYLLLLLASTALLLGLNAADAPRWMVLGLAAWWVALVTVAYVLQVRWRCIDTYQAIWGPDPTLPGAGVGPIGWGVRRRVQRIAERAQFDGGSQLYSTGTRAQEDPLDGY